MFGLAVQHVCLIAEAPPLCPSVLNLHGPSRGLTVDHYSIVFSLTVDVRVGIILHVSVVVVDGNVIFLLLRFHDRRACQE